MNTMIRLGDALNAEAARALSKNPHVGCAFAGYAHTTRALAANPKERLALPNNTAASNAVAMNTMANGGGDAMNSNASTSSFAQNPCAGIAGRTVDRRNGRNQRNGLYGLVCHLKSTSQMRAVAWSDQSFEPTFPT